RGGVGVGGWGGGGGVEDALLVGEAEQIEPLDEELLAALEEIDGEDLGGDGVGRDAREGAADRLGALLEGLALEVDRPRAQRDAGRPQRLREDRRRLLGERAQELGRAVG